MNLITHPQGYTFEYGSLLCGVCYGVTGSINGYVRCPPDHPQHGMHYDDLEVYVHGGLTWGRNHMPFQSRPHSEWWFGFDTSHDHDLFPLLETTEYAKAKKWLDDNEYTQALMELFDLEPWELGSPIKPEHRSEAYVILECQYLADQLMSVNTLPEHSKAFLDGQIRDMLYALITKQEDPPS